MLFSHRKKLKPLAKTIQIDSVDEELRSTVWSLLCLNFWDTWEPGAAQWKQDAAEVESLCQMLWFRYFKKPLDTLPYFKNGRSTDCYSFLRAYIFGCKWNEFYDFIEFIIKSSSERMGASFIEQLNSALELENSAYRIVGKEFIDVISKDEIEEIENALNSHHVAVKTHLERAVSLLSDKKSPDYRNSIKESVSAVESMVKIVSGESGATLAGGLKKLKDIAPLHPALEKAFLAIYGYTSDSGGIRHALLEESKIERSEARFMLIACSAFINFVADKYKR